MRSSVQFTEGLFLRLDEHSGVWFINGEVEGMAFHLNYSGSDCYWAAGLTMLSDAQKLRVRRRFNQYIRGTEPMELPWMTEVDGRNSNEAATRRAFNFHRQWCNRYKPGGGCFALNVPVGYERAAQASRAFQQEGSWAIGYDGDIAAVQQWLEPEDLAEWQERQQAAVLV